MARKTKVVIGTHGRDANKHFLLTEFPARRAEKWAERALLAATNAGVDIPPEVVKMGMGAVIAVGFRALLSMSFNDAEPLLDEMLECVQIVPDPKQPAIVRDIDDEDVEEVLTLLTLRSEVIDLHTGFSVAAFLSTLGTAATTDKTEGSPSTSTSPDQSEPS